MGGKVRFRARVRSGGPKHLQIFEKANTALSRQESNEGATRAYLPTAANQRKREVSRWLGTAIPNEKYQEGFYYALALSVIFRE